MNFLEEKLAEALDALNEARGRTLKAEAERDQWIEWTRIEKAEVARLREALSGVAVPAEVWRELALAPETDQSCRERRFGLAGGDE